MRNDSRTVRRVCTRIIRFYEDWTPRGWGADPNVAFALYSSSPYTFVKSYVSPRGWFSHPLFLISGRLSEISGPYARNRECVASRKCCTSFPNPVEYYKCRRSRSAAHNRSIVPQIVPFRRTCTSLFVSVERTKDGP